MKKGFWVEKTVSKSSAEGVLRVQYGLRAPDPRVWLSGPRILGPGGGFGGHVVDFYKESFWAREGPGAGTGPGHG